MADGPVFEFACNRLEVLSELDSSAIRGTVRIVLRDTGLDAKTVSSQQMVAVLEKVLPAELGSRGVADAEGICTTVSARVAAMGDSGGSGSAADAFVSRTRAV